MKKPVITLFLVIISLLFFTTGNYVSAETDECLSTLNPLEQVKLHPLVSDHPCVDFFEGALLGNGGLGAVVTTRPDAVVIHFGHNDIWDIRLAENNRDKIGTFQEVFERYRAIPDTVKDINTIAWYKEYSAMTRENYYKPYPRPFPCGSVLLWFDRRNAELLGHQVDIATGLCTVNFLINNKPAHLEMFVDMKHDILCARMTDETGSPTVAPFVFIELIPDPDTPKEFPSYTSMRNDSDGQLIFRQVLPYKETQPYEAHPRDKAFCLSARVGKQFDSKESYKQAKNYVPMGVNKENPFEGSLVGILDRTQPFFLTVQLDYGLASAIKMDSINIPLPTEQLFQNASVTSGEIWDEFWNKSGVILDDEFLERVWYQNLYFFRCAVRPGVTCPGLFANWNYKNIGTAWHGDYHMNYNTQQPFWVTFSSNHTDLNLSYVDMVETYLFPVAKRWAHDYYNLRGAYFLLTGYPLEMNMSPYPTTDWGWQVSMTPWTVQSLWWHYLYTMDTEFLKERGFPIIKEAVLFLVDYMKRPEAHGKNWKDNNYHIFPTIPPELYGFQPGFAKNYDCIADLTLTKFIFHAYVKACAILNLSHEEKDLITDVEDILNHFPNYPISQSRNGKVFVSVPGENPEVVYNAPVSLMTVFPGEDNGIFSSSNDYEVAVNTYRNQQNEGGNELVFLNVQAARLGVLDIKKFKRQIQYCLLPNGTCTDKVLQVHGRYTNATQFDYMGNCGIWFENFSLPVVINECLLQSYNGELRFFPNWPKDKNAEFRTLRAVGAFLVSAKWNNGTVEWIEVKSESGKSLTIISPWESGAVCQTSEGQKILSGKKFTIQTKRGEIIQLRQNR